MIIYTEIDNTRYRCNLSKPLDLSIPSGQVKCFYATDYASQPYRSGDFIGAVKAGAPVNFFDVQINPHGNGTHTECLGHITPEQELVNDQLQQYHFPAAVVSVPLTTLENGDQVISRMSLENACPQNMPPALIIRTLPNKQQKLTADYSGTNPPYLSTEAMRFIVEQQVKHLLIDLPSVDREVDEGKLLGHHLFWDLTNEVARPSTRQDCTISELIFVDDHIEDGRYLLNLQIPNIPLDAVPSKPVLYRLQPA